MSRSIFRMDSVGILLAGIFAIFLAVPLFRPYLISLGRIELIYAIFAVVGLLCIKPVIIVYTKEINWLDWLVHLFFLGFAAFAAANFQTIAFDRAGLILFLFIAYLYGRAIGNSANVRVVMAVLGAAFVLVSFYINYQLMLNGFSYNRYYNWSSASFKLGYLDYALFGVLTFIYVLDEKLGLAPKTVLCSYIFLSVAISGARYSILFLALAGAWKLARYLFRKPNIVNLSMLGLALVLVAFIAFLLFSQQRFAGMFDYSAGRLGALVTGDTSVSSRISTFDAALSAIGRSPLVGYGIGQGGTVLGVNYPHNIIFEISLESGILIGALFLAVLCSALWIATFAVLRGDAYLGVSIIYLIGAYLKSFTLYEARLLFFSLGVAAALASLRVRRSSSKVNAVPSNFVS